MRYLWDSLKIYCVDGQLLERINSSIKDACASVHVDRQLSESFGIDASVRRVCDATMAVQYLYA